MNRYIFGTTLVLANGLQAQARDVEDIEVYFGLGCYWHMQYEFVQGEVDILGRNYDEVTSIVGYAGGTQVGPQGQACYHGQYDYGDMGHAEVVNMNIPSDKFTEFAELYFSLFVNGARSDVGDRGPSYRQLVGIKGGMNSYLFDDLLQVADDY